MLSHTTRLTQPCTRKCLRDSRRTDIRDYNTVGAVRSLPQPRRRAQRPPCECLSFCVPPTSVDSSQRPTLQLSCIPFRLDLRALLTHRILYCAVNPIGSREAGAGLESYSWTPSILGLLPSIDVRGATNGTLGRPRRCGYAARGAYDAGLWARAVCGCGCDSMGLVCWR
ncbi:hypothetical protein DAEQUDRAFT_513563 [Daedalea quercina L-15889]|uniref:Uncharacterized protein n=1 Tax=Daedalea quercina L-15889 TaxID=1314783 RepID=A0A165MHR3_9APHY|nr:hypothetical protein DAEQUDRAFT_513563 [Daedalea quercina L-15889]